MPSVCSSAYVFFCIIAEVLSSLVGGLGASRRSPDYTPFQLTPNCGPKANSTTVLTNIIISRFVKKCNDPCHD